MHCSPTVEQACSCGLVVDHGQLRYNGSFWSEEVEFCSVLLLFCILILFLLCCFTDFRSMVELLKIRQPNHPTIYTATTIWTDCKAVCIKDRSQVALSQWSCQFLLLYMECETYGRFLHIVHVVGQRSSRLNFPGTQFDDPRPSA